MKKSKRSGTSQTMRGANTTGMGSQNNPLHQRAQSSSYKRKSINNINNLKEINLNNNNFE